MCLKTQLIFVYLHIKTNIDQVIISVVNNDELLLLKDRVICYWFCAIFQIPIFLYMSSNLLTWISTNHSIEKDHFFPFHILISF